MFSRPYPLLLVFQVYRYCMDNEKDKHHIFYTDQPLPSISYNVAEHIASNHSFCNNDKNEIYCLYLFPGDRACEIVPVIVEIGHVA